MLMTGIPYLSSTASNPKTAVEEHSGSKWERGFSGSGTAIRSHKAGHSSRQSTLSYKSRQPTATLPSSRPIISHH